GRDRTPRARAWLLGSRLRSRSLSRPLRQSHGGRELVGSHRRAATVDNERPMSMDAAGTPRPGRTIAVLALVLAVGACLRFRGLSTRGLWTDELVSWWAVSSRSWSELLQRCTTC